jgi:hypothetical protein
MELSASGCRKKPRGAATGHSEPRPACSAEVLGPLPILYFATVFRFFLTVLVNGFFVVWLVWLHLKVQFEVEVNRGNVVDVATGLQWF